MIPTHLFYQIYLSVSVQDKSIPQKYPTSGPQLM